MDARCVQVYLHERVLHGRLLQIIGARVRMSIRHCKRNVLFGKGCVSLELDAFGMHLVHRLYIAGIVLCVYPGEPSVFQLSL